MTLELASHIATFGIIVVGKGVDLFERNAALRCAVPANEYPEP